MDKNTAIRVESLGKMFYMQGQRRGYQSLRDTITDIFAAPFKRTLGLLRGHRSAAADLNQEFWALRDINFEMKYGEVLGIIGHNGAGKSTLLKILSQITEPTEGQALVRGRVGALLEVGTGFHPELTGRENVYLNGAILGMTKSEIDRKFDEIIAFAEVEQFVDTPVKHYSSGMGLRLGFAVAAHLEPEILIVDEVLAVGDANFQKKSLGRMTDVAQQGRTVLFVSHNLSAVQNMCTRVIWLDHGRIKGDGSPAEIVTRYLKSSVETQSEQVWNDPETAPGNNKVRIRRAAVMPQVPNEMDIIDMRTPIKVELEVWNKVEDAYLDIRLDIYNEEGILLFASGSSADPKWHGKPMPVGLYHFTCYIPGDLLNAGTHRIGMFCQYASKYTVFRYNDIVSFEVLDSADTRGGWYGKRRGAVRPLLNWEVHAQDQLTTTERS